MRCVHCHGPLSGGWHIAETEPLPVLQVGGLVVAKKMSGVCDPGERGVVYEAYGLAGRLGCSIIFESGRHDGFSPCEVDFFLDVTGEVCEPLAGYRFENVHRLCVDFGNGVFEPALGAESRRAILDRWHATGNREV